MDAIPEFLQFCGWTLSDGENDDSVCARRSFLESADGFGCLFFPETAICLAVFELGRTYRAMRACPLTDAAALMNAIYRDFPDYAAKYNLMEQSGDANRSASPDWMISLTPNAGTAFPRF